jgi:hypothetical protein
MDFEPKDKKTHIGHLHCLICEDSGRIKGLGGPFEAKPLAGFCKCVLGQRLLWCKLNRRPLSAANEIGSLPFSQEDVETWARPQNEEEFFWALRQNLLYKKTPGDLWYRMKDNADARLLAKTLFSTPAKLDKEPEKVVMPYKDNVRIKPAKDWGED